MLQYGSFQTECQLSNGQHTHIPVVPMIGRSILTSNNGFFREIEMLKPGYIQQSVFEARRYSSCKASKTNRGRKVKQFHLVCPISLRF